MTTNEYNPFQDDLPRVQIPLGRDTAGLTIDGDFTPFHRLPYEAQRVYRKYAEQGGNVRIYQCDRCGYLTDSDAFSATTYNRAYECGNCGARLKGTTQNRPRESYTMVHGPYVEPDDDNYVDIPSLVPEAKCDHAGDASDCEKCVPNHPSHFGKLRNAAVGEITQSEMLLRVAEAVEDDRS